MKSVLLSIKPVWCSKIVRKEKTVEVRKTKPEGVKPPFKCYIYCTKDQSKMGWLRIVPGKGWQRLDGMVIGGSSATRFGSLHRYAAPRMMSKKWLAWTETALSTT